MSVFDYKRRQSRSVNIGGIPLGSDYPIRLQSMTSTSTMDTETSVKQCQRIAEAGADYIRLTAQGVKEAENIGVIGDILRKQNINTPLVADIHFNPKAAFAAAPVVQKVRINPGNFVDPGRTFRQLTYTDDEYATEIEKIKATLIPFLNLCKENNTAIRIGVNHGSLSDRIMSRYGDTPAGMVESAMEFLRVCVAQNFMDVVISIKASNTVIMVETVRRLVVAMRNENMDFPLHLGVTEAGDGEDGRVKSAVGIGTLLSEGIGDTIRVSLSEEPELEIPVAASLVNYISKRNDAPTISGNYSKNYCYESPKRRKSTNIAGKIGADMHPIVIADNIAQMYNDGCTPDYFFLEGIDNTIEINPEKIILPYNVNTQDNRYCRLFTLQETDKIKTIDAHIKFLHIDASTPINDCIEILNSNKELIIILTSAHLNPTGEIQAFIHSLIDADINNPIIIKMKYNDSDNEVALKAATDLGAMLMNGFRDGIWIEAPNADKATVARLSFGILQATRLRITRTEYISCPSCGRTLFDLQSTLKEVKAATAHLKGLKIGVMGCIVNGPGEMADADYGYVGAATGKVSLYKGKTCIEKNIPTAEAIEHLIALIKREGDWIEPTN